MENTNRHIKVYITDGDQVGTATYQHPIGKLPTDDEALEVLEKVLAALPEDFRLMNRAETMMHFLREEKGYRGSNMAIPKSKDAEWYDPETDVDFSDTNNESDLDEDEW